MLKKLLNWLNAPVCPYHTDTAVNVKTGERIPCNNVGGKLQRFGGEEVGVYELGKEWVLE